MYVVLIGACAYESSDSLWETRVLNPFLVCGFEPEILRQVLYCPGVFPVEGIKHEDVGKVPGRAWPGSLSGKLVRERVLSPLLGGDLNIATRISSIGTTLQFSRR